MQPTINIQKIIALARTAGNEIMNVYAQEFSVELKGDNSPLTQADKRSNTIIINGLKELYPEIPIISEETKLTAYNERKSWNTYWLVDPLDGTREFVKKNGEFTVNIALIENHEPVFGVVYAPALDELHYGERGRGAFVRTGADDVALSTRRPAVSPLRVAASRSHLDERTAALLARLGEIETASMGSSLKFCRIAEARI